MTAGERQPTRRSISEESDATNPTTGIADFLSTVNRYEKRSVRFPARPAGIIKAVSALLHVDPNTALRMVNYGLYKRVFIPDGLVRSHSKPLGISAFDQTSFESILVFCRGYREKIFKVMGIDFDANTPLVLTSENNDVMFAVNRRALITAVRQQLERANLPDHAKKINSPVEQPKAQKDIPPAATSDLPLTSVGAISVNKTVVETTSNNPKERLQVFLQRFDVGTIRELERCNVSHIVALIKRLDQLDQNSRSGVFTYADLGMEAQDNNKGNIVRRRAFFDAIIAVGMYIKYVRDNQALPFSPGSLPTCITAAAISRQVERALKDFQEETTGIKSKQALAISLGYAIQTIQAKMQAK